MKIQFLIFKEEIIAWVLLKVIKQKCCRKDSISPQNKNRKYRYSQYVSIL